MVNLPALSTFPTLPTFPTIEITLLLLNSARKARASGLKD